MEEEKLMKMKQKRKKGRNKELAPTLKLSQELSQLSQI